MHMLYDFLPLAHQKGWPSTIDWEQLPAQLFGMKPRLDLIINCPLESEWFSTISEEWHNGCCWSQASNVSMFGIDKIERNPGYYGEIGQLWIYASLKCIYPEGSISQDLFSPMSVQGFLSEVLMMEAALLLVQKYEDGTAAETVWKEMAGEQRLLLASAMDTTKDGNTITIKQEPEGIDTRVDDPTTWRIIHNADGAEVWVIDD
ncbi:hypothetical protein K439DRAFT_1616252 [Ramaria rubella]|nr:hypothetical protein K439DRAFT_1616252 [Ramaria rubella]